MIKELIKELHFTARGAVQVQSDLGSALQTTQQTGRI